MTPPPKLYIIIKQIVFSKNTNYVVFLFFLGEGGGRRDGWEWWCLFIYVKYVSRNKNRKISSSLVIRSSAFCPTLSYFIWLQTLWWYFFAFLSTAFRYNNIQGTLSSKADNWFQFFRFQLESGGIYKFSYWQIYNK